MDADSPTWLCWKKFWKTILSMKRETSGMRSLREIAPTISLPMQQTTHFPACVATHTTNTIRGIQVSLRKKLDVQKCCVYAKKTYCCYDRKSNSYIFGSKGLNKGTLEDCGEGRMSKYRKVLDESVTVTPTNRKFRTFQHGVATYEQTKKRFAYFYPERIVEVDWIHTKPLHW